MVIGFSRARRPESLGEDPFLAGETVAQEIAAAKARHVIATLKHHVANDQETERIGLRLPPDGVARSGGINVLAAERAAGDLRGAVQARRPPQRRRLGHVPGLLDPDAVDMAAVFADFLDRLRPQRG